MTTAIKYNDVIIWGCVTQEFTQETVADDSGTDVLYERFRVSVSGYIHAATTSGKGPSHFPKQASNSQGAAQNEVSIRHKLMEYRKPFEMHTGCAVSDSGNITGGYKLLEAIPAEASSSRKIEEDVNNGPKPISLKITHISDNTIFRVEYTIEVCRIECESGVLGNVVNNRWSMSDDYDQNFYCTRVITGVLRTRTANVNPHDFRNSVVPALEPGFYRSAMHFVSTEDGMNLQYSVTDRSLSFAPPFPATSWNLTHRMMIDMAGGTRSEVAITMSGPRDASVATMLSKAGAIIDAKLLFSQNKNSKNFFVPSYEMSTTISENENQIEARAVAVHLGQPLADMRTIGNVMVRPVDAAIIAGYDRNKAISPDVNGDTQIKKAFSAYLQSPCQFIHDFPNGTKPTESQNQPIDTPSTTVTSTTVPSSAYLIDPALSTSQYAAIYTSYQADSRYERFGGRGHFPVSKHQRAGQSTTSSTPDWVTCPIFPPGCRLHTSVAAKRVGESPKFPVPQDYEVDGIKYSLLDFDVVVTDPEVLADGKRLYTARAEYTYGMDKPPPTGQLRYLPAPWLSNPDTLTSSDFLTGGNV